MTPAWSRQAPLLLLASVLAWSTAGLFTRAIALDAPTLLFWRGALGAVFVAAMMLAGEGRAAWAGLRRVGWPELATVLLTTTGAISTIVALRLAPVANVVLVFASTPIVAAALSALLLGARLSGRTLAACLLALAGAAILVGPDPGLSLAGSAVALGVPVSVALGIVVIRGALRFSVMANTLLASLALAACFLPLASLRAPSAAELGLLAAFAFTQTCIGGVLFAVASRRVDPTANALLQLLDIPLSIAWVWLGFGERPSLAAMLGGAVILAAVTWYQRLHRAALGPRAARLAGQAP